MLFIDSSIRCDRQLEHTWNQSVIQVLTTVPGWLASTNARMCVRACVCVVQVLF